MAVVEDFAPQSTQVISIINPKTDKAQSFTVKRHVSVPGYLEADHKVKARIDAMEKNKKLAVVVPNDVVEKHPQEFKDAKPFKDGTSEIFLTDKREIQIATTLEISMVDPELTWSQAVVWTRIAAPLSFAIVAQLDKLNTEVAIEEAKNV